VDDEENRSRGRKQLDAHFHYCNGKVAAFLEFNDTARFAEAYRG
jgi:hypothetical protein